MHGTTRGLRTDSGHRLAELERQRPEWRGWLRLLVETRRALDDGGRAGSVAEVQPGGAAGAPPDGAPLLHGRTLAVDAARVQRLVHRLASLAADGHLEGAASLEGYRPSRPAAVELLQAAVRQDGDAIAALAASADVAPGALASVAHFAALPPLHSCGRLLAERVPRHWPRGYCPICAGGPLLVEERGLDRTRWARCGRCGGEWQAQWLRCIHCGEDGHERLGSLVPEAGGEVLNVETCATCRGYLKCVTTLLPIPSPDLALRDLETVELDLVALDRGYRRPGEPGFPLELRVVPRTG